MHLESRILDLPSPQPASDSPPPVPDFSHRGNGKIARLPKPIRDQINNWILDGLSYPDIIERLGEHGQELKPGHLSEYKKRGYADWIRQREWFEHVTSKSEFSKDLLTAPDTATLHEAGLRMAAAQMLDQLMLFGAAIDAQGSQREPEKFARLVNALSRLTREALAFQKYHDACAKHQAQKPNNSDPAQQTSQKARDFLLNGWRDFFGHDLTQPLPGVAQTSPSAASETSTPPVSVSLVTPIASGQPVPKPEVQAPKS